MKVAIIGSGNFIGKNLAENLKNIQTGKNRTRPDLSITDIYCDEVNDAEDVIIRIRQIIARL